MATRQQEDDRRQPDTPSIAPPGAADVFGGGGGLDFGGGSHPMFGGGSNPNGDVGTSVPSPWSGSGSGGEDPFSVDPYLNDQGVLTNQGLNDMLSGGADPVTAFQSIMDFQQSGTGPGGDRSTNVVPGTGGPAEGYNPRLLADRMATMMSGRQGSDPQFTDALMLQTGLTTPEQLAAERAESGSALTRDVDQLRALMNFDFSRPMGGYAGGNAPGVSATGSLGQRAAQWYGGAGMGEDGTWSRGAAQAQTGGDLQSFRRMMSNRGFGRPDDFELPEGLDLPGGFGPPVRPGTPRTPKPPIDGWWPGPGEWPEPGEIPPWGGPPTGTPGTGGTGEPPTGPGGWPPATPPPRGPGGGGPAPTGPGGTNRSYFDPYQFNFPGPVDPGARTDVPGRGPLSGQLEQYASDWMNNPSRFDIGLVEDITSAINHELDRAGQAGYRRLDERMASRGLTGSNIEAETGRRIAEDLNQDRLQRLNALNMELARTAGADRARAGQFGLGANQQIFGQDMGRAQFGEGMRRFDADFGLNQRAQQLREQGMKSDEAYRRAQMEMEHELQSRGFDIEEELARNDQRMQALQLLLQAMSAGNVLGEDFIEALG